MIFFVDDLKHYKIKIHLQKNTNIKIQLEAIKHVKIFKLLIFDLIIKSLLIKSLKSHIYNICIVKEFLYISFLSTQNSMTYKII